MELPDILWRQSPSEFRARVKVWVRIWARDWNLGQSLGAESGVWVKIACQSLESG